MDTKYPTDKTEENPELTEQQSDVTASEDFFQHAKKSEEEEDGDAAIASAPAITAPVDMDNPLFLHVYEHHTSHATLTLDEETMLLYLNPTQGTSHRKTIHFRGRGGEDPLIIECYPFKEGRSLRFNDCDLFTTTGRGDDQIRHNYKEYHVHLPQDVWHAGFSHEVMTGRERRAYGPHNPQQAEYNAGVFPRFMDALERMVGAENMMRCKKVGDELVDDDAEEEDSDGDVE
ncbi:hypothetical protein J4E86_010985 [Alternaria arbusti]|uniref:uncharacterized protein n=1 Tax=Alternaria arbusti TaxID=232088 RepID=UPI00221E55BB|nr:uncharacterized protein J4E86_010985 [Alternaria arbusti]KAI4940351.1 hypothetical protein J4E86_010985 [Alternaria arbusti]